MSGADQVSWTRQPWSKNHYCLDLTRSRQIWQRYHKIYWELAKFGEISTKSGGHLTKSDEISPNLAETSSNLVDLNRNYKWKTLVFARFSWFLWLGRVARVLEEETCLPIDLLMLDFESGDLPLTVGVVGSNSGEWDGWVSLLGGLDTPNLSLSRLHITLIIFYKSQVIMFWRSFSLF